MLLPTFENMFNSLPSCHNGCQSINFRVHTIYSVAVAFSAMVVALTIPGSTGINIFIDNFMHTVEFYQVPFAGNL